jgi:hypothetical protein
MLCTNSPVILNSLDGRVTLNYRPASNPPSYNPDKYNLLMVWDILMQDYRCINMSYCNLIARIPANEQFWEYFNENLAKISTNKKMFWMNS